MTKSSRSSRAIALAAIALAQCGTATSATDRSIDGDASDADADVARPCPARRPENGIPCPGDQSCLYPDVLCQCDPSHGWVCNRTCPPQPPAIGDACSALYDCDYGDFACHCDGATWSCSGAACVTAWPMPNTPSYAISRDVVVDRTTGLAWQREVDPGNHDWADAKRYCDDLELAGLADWRLPTRIELVSITDLARRGPAIDADAFPRTPSAFYWTSSPRPGSDLAWSIDFESGSMYSSVTSFAVKVRCVRTMERLAAIDGGESCYVVRPDIVYDVQTELTWQRAFDATTYSFGDARAHCASLALDGGGWRVPTIKELQTIVDDKRVDPAVDLATFPGTPSRVFWSSSVATEPEAFGWYLDFFSGYTFAYEQMNANQVRCVR